jgi:hypothetical protein
MATGRDKALHTFTNRRRERARKATRRRMHLEHLEARQMFAAPQLASINPNVGDVFDLNGTNVRNIAPRELTIRFDDGQVIDPASVTNANVQIIRSGLDGTFGQANDVVITPGYIGIGEAPNEIVVRFKENLPDDLYRVTLVGSGATPLRNTGNEAFNSGADRQVGFELDLGAQVIAVVPQPVVRVGSAWQQRRDQIEVYFNDDNLDPALASNVKYYKLIFTNNTVSNTDDATVLPTSAVYDAAADKVTLTFAKDLALLTTGPGTYRLRIGTNETTPPPPISTNLVNDPGSSFATANNIGALSATGRIFTAAIEAEDYSLVWPGGIDEPGHRDIPQAETHLNGDADIAGGTPVRFYNFSPTINGFFNFITEPQKQRAREIFEIYGHYLGIDFVESETQGTIIATADLASVGGASAPGGVAGLGSAFAAVMDVAELNWNDDYGGSWFDVAMHEIGHGLGLGHTYDLPPGTNMGSQPLLGFDNRLEPIFPGAQDIVHGQYLFRPDSTDIDLYKFTVPQSGTLSAETFAERLPESSRLDTVLTLYREVSGVREVIARNDNYYSDDSFLKLQLEAGTYYIGVSSTGNTNYDPTIVNSGIGGTSNGPYQLRLDFRADVTDTLKDATGTAFDGDLDGAPGGVYNFWFRTATTANTFFVDKAATGAGDGTVASPFGSLQAALAIAGQNPGSIVRVLGNGGADGNLATVADNIPYQIGVGPPGNSGPLPDGRGLEVPKDVTLMIDAGAIFKMRRSRISVGSDTATIDRSGGALQILGTPTNSVVFTSYDDDKFGGDTNRSPTQPAAGNWGGILFQADIDRADQRFDYDREGIFLNYVNHADIRYGGGSAEISGGEVVVMPIQMVESRPTITFNQITLSADAAMAADPNSFEETNFQSPPYQLAAAFTSDYDRVGPDIYGNQLQVTEIVNGVPVSRANSINGLFVRIKTPAGDALHQLTVPGRFDDLDIVHILKENLLIEGTPGGGIQSLEVPPVETVTLTPRSGGTLPAGTYTYRITYVDSSGNEGAASAPTSPLTIDGIGVRTIRLDNLPPASAGYVARRIYRSNGGAYELVAQINPNSASYTDNGTTAGGELKTNDSGILARTDARLAIDGGIVLKMDGARIEATISSQLLVEGTNELPVVITSIRDDRYGAGGTFDQTGLNTPNTPARGDWGGLFFGPISSGSIDHAVIAYGGGAVTIDGTFTGYNALEIYQADVRIANSIIEQSATGRGGQAPDSRFGDGFNEPATIFVRGAQPVIINNIIRNNAAVAISINTNSLNHYQVTDWGRSTGELDRLDQFLDNQGPLVRLNRLANNGINGMNIRGETLQTQGVWDDTDITHVLQETVYIPDFHTFGGLRIQSSQAESLVVKLLGQNAGITATGRPLDIDDRIGGMLHVVGQPGRPVIFTSLNDDTVGAGKRPDGRPQFDTNNNGTATGPSPGDWRSLLIDQYAHDRNVQVIMEAESAGGDAPGNNSTPAVGQQLGGLAPAEKNADENRRLGFEVHGFLNASNDIDVYSFTAPALTEVWLDIDRTSFALDAVLELVNNQGDVLARSVNSTAETAGAPTLTGLGMKLQKTPPFNGADYYTTNPKDPGLRVILPGPKGTTNTYHVRVRSNSPNLDANLGGGLTSGAYQLQIRLREIDEQPGSIIQYANIAYATNGIEVLGQPTHSALLGEASETLESNDTLATATDLGNLLNSDRSALSIAGSLGKTDPLFNLSDVDFYRFQVSYDSTQQIPGVTAPAVLSTIFDLDYGDRVTSGNMSLWLFDAGGRLVMRNISSNISDDLPRINKGDDTADLSRGTLNGGDPLIGTQILPEGVYYIAVSRDGVVPTELAANSLLRLEPINSVIRIAEDHIGAAGGGTAADPVVPVLLDQNSVVPFFLGDVTLFFTQQTPLAPGVGPQATRLLTVDPFTGAIETVVNNNLANSDNSFSRDIGDIAFRSDNELFAFSIDTQNPVIRSDAGSGNYLQISTADGTVVNVGDDGIVTYEADPAGLAQNPPVFQPVVGNLGPGNVRYGYGVQFNALTFHVTNDNVERLYAVGNRGDSAAEGNARNNFVALKENILYEFNTQTGAAIFDPNSPTLIDGDRAPYSSNAATDAVEVGEVLTAPRITAIDPTTQSNINGNLITNFVLNDGNTFTVTDRDITTAFEFDAGFDFQQNINVVTGNTIRDGNFFILDDQVFQFDTGPVISIGVDGGQLTDGIVVTVNGNGTAASFEFDNSPPGDPNAMPNPIPDVPQRDPNATPIRFGPGTTSVQLAGLLADAINAAMGINVAAATVGSRVNLVNETTVAINLPPATPVTQVLVTGDRGAAPIIHIQDNALINDGDFFTVAVGFPQQNVRFEFDTGNGVTGGSFAVQIGADAAQTASNLRQAAINATAAGIPLTSQLANDKVVLNGQNITFGASSNLNAVVNLVTPGNQIISVEENFLAPAIGQAVENTINQAAFAPIQVGSEFTRINFINALEGEFAVPIWAARPSINGVNPGSVPVPFRADDTPAQLATRIANAINAGFPSVTATAANQFVRLDHGSATVQAPLIAVGEGPGGIIKGMTSLNGTVYAVSDNGGLYTVFASRPGLNQFVNTNYIATSLDDLEGIEFSGLTAGPQNVEGGRYANLLFATDTNGRLYAFNTAGVLQPIFVNGATSVATGLTEVNGLAFSQLDRNLWNLTNNRGADPGHGINPTFDETRTTRVAGGTSFYFGAEPLERNYNYDFTGGAYGTLVTNEFSLKGYSASDQPTLYFNYFLDGDGANDAFKVFASGYAGEWSLLNTVTADSGTWRQVRVSLAGFAGQEGVRLRFDFSTAGEMNTGDLNTTGDELRAVPGYLINDGDTFLIDNTTYEFEVGPSIVTDTGAALVDGERFTLTTDQGTQTFEFDNNNAPVGAGNILIPFNSLMSAEQVAQAIRTSIDNSGLLGVQTFLVTGGNRLNLKGLTDITQTTAPGGGFFPALVIQGTIGVDLGNVLIDVNVAMDRIEVANAIDAVLEQTLVEQRLVLSNGSVYADGDTFTLGADPLAVPAVLGTTFEFESGYILQIPAVGVNPTGIQDGNFFKLSDGVNTAVFVYDSDMQVNYAPLPGETVQVVTVVPGMSQAAVGRAVEAAIDAVAALPAFATFGIDGRFIGNGRVQIGGVEGVVADLAGTPTMTSVGTPGVAPGRFAIPFSPTTNFTSNQMALAVSAAINAAAIPGYTARVDATDQRRVVIERAPSLDPINVDGIATVAEQTTNDVSKQHGDLLRIIGHMVNPNPTPPPAPLPPEGYGLEYRETLPANLENFYRTRGVNITLEGDVASYPFNIQGLTNRRVGFNSPTRGQNNAFEGFYLDDIIIGFAERGEMATAATANTVFNINPNIIAAVQAAADNVAFPYQLEIRRGQDYSLGSVLIDTFDTNDRLTSSYQLFAPRGNQLVDGQFFILTDGVKNVRFEFDDLASPRVQPTVAPGSVAIPFRANQPDYTIAAAIVAAINGSTSQTNLPSITASISSGGGGNDNRVNLTGPASLGLNGTINGGLQIVQSTTSGNLLRDTLLGPNVTPEGNATLLSGATSAGTFRNGANVIGIDSGIILSTGDVFSAEGPNVSDSSSGDASLQGDPQLDATFNVATTDTTSLSFSFNFPGGDFSFRFVFASEEYNEYANDLFNDVFAFYLSGGALVGAENLAVVPGTNTPISVNTINGGNPLGVGAVNPNFYNNNDPSDAGANLATFGYDGFTDVLTARRANLPAGVYTIKLAISDVFDSILDSAVFIEANTFGAVVPPPDAPPEGIPGKTDEYYGDKNLFRDQGQILIVANRVTDSAEFGIVADAGQRSRPDLVPLAGDLPHDGPPRNLRTLNVERLAPGVVIQNNVIATSGTGGIHISGDPNLNGPTQLAAVPFARVINNTIYGGGVGVGIQVDENASPTLLNNIVADLATGVSVDATSGSTVLGGMLYRGNGVNTTGVGIGDFALILNATDPLFVNEAQGNFYLERLSRAIDSSVDTVPDRNNYVNYLNPLGIGISPLLSPDLDVFGQVRKDDPEVSPPLGQGANVFKDRGAIDRVDFAGPTAFLITPRDNDANGLDTNLNLNDVLIGGVTFNQFAVQLVDGLDPFEPQNGTGIDDSSVTAATVTLTRDGVELVQGLDYNFRYDPTNDTITLIPLTGLWTLDHTYVITLDNSEATGIRDQAGNPLKPNRADLSTYFTIELSTEVGPPVGNGIDFGDAPDPTYPTLLVNNGARHAIVPGVRLGATVTAEANGKPNVTATGDEDDGVMFASASNEIVRGKKGTQVTVLPSVNGFIDAWIDYNRNGNWNDPGEQIFTSRAVVGGGPVVLSFDVPGNASLGATYARFRFSTTGGLSTVGIATDGEVEDYRITIAQNPYQNPNFLPGGPGFENVSLDVNADGVISPIDALLIVNYINFFGVSTSDLPLPRPGGPAKPYMDVNGDNRIDATDAQLVTNYLNNPNPSPGPEPLSWTTDAAPGALPLGEPVSNRNPLGTGFPWIDGAAASGEPVADFGDSQDAFTLDSLGATAHGALPLGGRSSGYDGLDLYGGSDDRDDLDGLLDELTHESSDADEFFAWLGE